MPECAVGLMAKYPLSGKVKTRLAVDIGESRALAVYRLLLQRAATTVCGLKPSRFQRTVFVAPAVQIDAFRREYQGFDRYAVQNGENLGQRMRNALTELLELSNIESALLIGSDIPQLSPDLIDRAHLALHEHDLVLGPTVDGGYYLIGLGEIESELFTGIEWGTDSVLADTLRAADAKRLSVHLLPNLRDLDTEADLKHFEADGVFRI
jgi:rSAM/selenodomain-associated transferase 1